MTLVEDLTERLATSCGETALDYIAERLSDADLLLSELGDADAAIEAAEADEGTAITWMTGAFERFPVNTETFPHSAHVDPRAHAVLATHRLAQKAGLYVPSELREMQERGEVTRAWQAREGFRFRLFSALSRALGDAMVDSGITPSAYVTKCQSIAKDLGKIEIAAPDPPPA